MGDLAREPDGGADALVHQLTVRNSQLEQALESRIVIEQAKGVLAERHGIPPEQAFELLRRASRNTRRRIHDLAAAVVATAGERNGGSREKM